MAATTEPTVSTRCCASFTNTYTKYNETKFCLKRPQKNVQHSVTVLSLTVKPQHISHALDGFLYLSGASGMHVLRNNALQAGP